MQREQKLQKRKTYLEKIKKYVWSPVIKVITWMRRCGKSSFLQTVFEELQEDAFITKSELFYVNKELLEFNFIKDFNDIHTYFIAWKKKNCITGKFVVWIDEIQEIFGREKFINSILAEYQNDVEIFITWSNATLLSSQLSTHIAWRYIEFPIYPLSFKEFWQFARKDLTEELFFDYIKYGWLPGIFNLKYEEEVIYDYLKWVYNTIFVKDILSVNKINSTVFFTSLYEYLFKNIWSVFTANSIADYLKSQKINIGVDTILNYIQYGIDSYVLQKFKKYDIKGKKIFQIYEKYFATDLGIRHSQVWYNFKSDIGNILENIVFCELKRRWYDIFLGKFTTWEIDFVAKKWWTYEYYQVAYIMYDEETREREFRWLLAINDNRPKFVLSLDKTFANTYKWIKHLHIIDRLTQ